MSFQKKKTSNTIRRLLQKNVSPKTCPAAPKSCKSKRPLGSALWRCLHGESYICSAKFISIHEAWESLTKKRGYNLSQCICSAANGTTFVYLRRCCICLQAVHLRKVFWACMFWRNTFQDRKGDATNEKTAEGRKHLFDESVQLKILTFACSTLLCHETKFGPVTWQWLFVDNWESLSRKVPQRKQSANSACSSWNWGKSLPCQCETRHCENFTSRVDLCGHIFDSSLDWMILVEFQLRWNAISEIMKESISLFLASRAAWCNVVENNLLVQI